MGLISFTTVILVYISSGNTTLSSAWQTLIFNGQEIKFGVGTVVTQFNLAISFSLSIN